MGKEGKIYHACPFPTPASSLLSPPGVAELLGASFPLVVGFGVSAPPAAILVDVTNVVCPPPAAPPPPGHTFRYQTSMAEKSASEHCFGQILTLGFCWREVRRADWQKQDW